MVAWVSAFPTRSYHLITWLNITKVRRFLKVTSATHSPDLILVNVRKPRHRKLWAQRTSLTFASLTEYAVICFFMRNVKHKYLLSYSDICLFARTLCQSAQNLHRSLRLCFSIGILVMDAYRCSFMGFNYDCFNPGSTIKPVQVSPLT